KKNKSAPPPSTLIITIVLGSLSVFLFFLSWAGFVCLLLFHRAPPRPAPTGPKPVPRAAITSEPIRHLPAIWLRLDQGGGPDSNNGGWQGAPSASAPQDGGLQGRKSGS